MRISVTCPIARVATILKCSTSRGLNRSHSHSYGNFIKLYVWYV